jgi:hypothetical protein
MKSKIKPIVSWSIWAGGLSLVMGFVTRNHILAGFRADETGMSYVIATLFGVGLAVSFRAALQLHNEWSVLNQTIATDQIPAGNGKGGLADVFNNLAGYRDAGETVDIHAAIDTYHAGHNSRVRSVSIMAALLISMGLLGTIVGLIMSISGLGGMVENIGLSRATMMAELKTTVAGMGTAFYTTFFGALGGLILRAVAVSQLNSLSELCAAATEYADTDLVAKLENKEEAVNQQISRVVESFKNMQQEIENSTERIAATVTDSLDRFGEALETAGRQAVVVTEKCVGDMSSQITLIGAELRHTFESFGAAIEASGEGISTSFGSLSNSVDQAGEVVGGSLADFKLSVDGTSNELNTAVTELRNAIHEATGEMASLSEAKLDTEAHEIAGQLSLAADSIQTFLKSKAGGTSKNQKVA